MNLDELLKHSDNLKAYINTLPYEEDDVRKSFFGIMYSGVYDYYTGHVFYQLAKYIEHRKVTFDSSIIHFNPHAKRIYEIANHPYLTHGHFNTLNRNIFLDGWTAFEHSVSLIFDFIIDSQKKEEIVNEINAKIIRICQNLGEEDFTRLKSELTKITFIPLIRKFKLLAKRVADCYQGDYKEDTKFLEFLSKLRNCMSHSNGLYHGSNFNFEFNGIVFSFVNNEIMGMHGNNEDVFLEINDEIIEIFKRLLHCLTDIDSILYPEDGQ